MGGYLYPCVCVCVCVCLAWQRVQFAESLTCGLSIVVFLSSRCNTNETKPNPTCVTLIQKDFFM